MTSKQFVDGAISLHTHSGGRGGDGVGGHHQAHLFASWRQGNRWAVVQGTGHATFRMGAHVNGGAGKRLLDDLQIEQVVRATSGNHPKISGADIEEGSGIAIQAIQPHEDGSHGEFQVGRIAGEHLEHLSKFAPVIPIARPPKRAEKLMRMRLEHHCTRPHHFSSLAPLVARRADVVETPMGSRQCFCLRQRSLARGLSRTIHIDYEPLPACSINQA